MCAHTNVRKPNINSGLLTGEDASNLDCVTVEEASNLDCVSVKEACNLDCVTVEEACNLDCVSVKEANNLDCVTVEEGNILDWNCTSRANLVQNFKVIFYKFVIWSFFFQTLDSQICLQFRNSKIAFSSNKCAVSDMLGLFRKSLQLVKDMAEPADA